MTEAEKGLLSHSKYIRVKSLMNQYLTNSEKLAQLKKLQEEKNAELMAIHKLKKEIEDELFSS